jgi:hypothetical protein
MVHALHEAQRVLRPDGLLVDLRPAAVHRRVGVIQAGRYRPLGAMRETFDDDRAADCAVTQVEGEGRLKAEGRAVFACNRIMDSLDEFQEWLADFVKLGNLPSHDWLVRRVERALDVAGGRARVVVSGPLVLRLLRKQEATAQPAVAAARRKRGG